MYELVYVVRPTVDESALAALRDKVEKFIVNARGAVSQRDDWGKRTLAYPIAKFTEGFYTILQFEMPTAGVSELERSLGLQEEILRHLVVRQETPVPAPTK